MLQVTQTTNRGKLNPSGITSTIAQGRRALGSGVRVAYRPGTLLFVVGDRDLG
jgi:ribosomal protein S18